MKTTLILIGIIGLALCGCQSKTQPNSKLKADKMEAVKAIEATLKSYEIALNDSNTDAVVALYAQDGVFMPSEAPSAQGAEQVRAAYNHVFSNIKLDIAFSIDEIVPQGDFAFARTLSKGNVTVLAQGVTLPEENRELFVLKKTDGDWKIARYMFNKMSPPAGQ